MIGRPLRNLRAYVLDDRLRPVPVGVRRRAAPRRRQLARGYLNRPGLTADRFLADPFGPPGSRMYATGDRVRWTAEGDLEYLGRVDDQVKMRGFRIEPGEIEAALLRPARGRRRGRRGPPRTTATAARSAYVVPGAGPSTELRAAAARQSLPDYLVPSVFVALDRLPTTQQRQDRPPRAAGDPRSTGRRPSGWRRATPAERLLAEIWADVLGVRAGRRRRTTSSRWAATRS